MFFLFNNNREKSKHFKFEREVKAKVVGLTSFY